MWSMCLITIFLLGHDCRIFAKVADFEEIFFELRNIPFPIFLYVNI